MPDKLEEIVEKALKIFDEKTTCEVRDLTDEKEDNIRKLLRYYGVKNLEKENQYIECLREIDLILQLEQDQLNLYTNRWRKNPECRNTFISLN